MTEFILSTKNKHISAQATLDLYNMRLDFITAQALQKRYPDSLFLAGIATKISKNLVGTGYNVIPEAKPGLRGK
jgi:hypothetical protein